MAEKKPTIGQLEREYDRLLKECGEFAPETKRLQQVRDDAQAAFVAERKRLAAQLLARKGQAFAALQSARAETAPAPAPAAEQVKA